MLYLFIFSHFVFSVSIDIWLLIFQILIGYSISNPFSIILRFVLCHILDSYTQQGLLPVPPYPNDRTTIIIFSSIGVFLQWYHVSLIVEILELVLTVVSLPEYSLIIYSIYFYVQKHFDRHL